MSATLTLQELASAARWQGRNPCIINTGGGVMALSLIVDGAHALVALDYGHMSGSEWSVSLDSDTREQYGEQEITAPVISDADQTIADAVAWVRINVHGDESPFPLPADALTDKALCVEMMRANEAEDWDRAAEMSDALERRHAGASERLADKVTGWHMAAEDATRWALDWSDCRAWVEGFRHGQRVRHARTGDTGTVVGQRDAGESGVIWDDAPESVDSQEWHQIIGI